jgi:hypothetical protein
MGLVDGVTTNPTFCKEGEETEKLIRKIWQEVRGPVNVEVVGTPVRRWRKRLRWPLGEMRL